MNESFRYAVHGEQLIHGIGEASAYHLPSATVLAALLFSHWRISAELLGLSYVLALTLLLLAVERPLGVRGLLGLAPLLAILFCPWQFPQGVMALFVLLVAGFLVRYAAAPTHGSLIGLALAIGGSFTFRSSLAFLPPVLAAFVFATRLPGRAAAVKHAMILLVVPYLFVAPALRMNYGFQRRLIPFEDGQASSNIVAGALGLVETVEGPWGALMPDSGEPSPRREVLAWATKEVLRNPARYGAAYLRRVVRAVIWSAPWIFLALWAFWLQRKRREFQALGLVVAYFIGIHCLMAVQDDYFAPLQPLLILMACALTGRILPSVLLPSKLPAVVLAGALAGVLVLNGYAMSLMAKAGRAGLEQALSRSSDDWWLLHTRGKERLKRGAFPGAEADLSRALASKPPERHAPYLGVELEAQLAMSEMFQDRFNRVWDIPVDRYQSFDAKPAVRVHLIRAYARSRAGRPQEAAQEMMFAMQKVVSTFKIRGAQPGGRENDALARLKQAGDEDFCRVVESLLHEWPLTHRSEVTGLLILAGLKSAPVWLLHAEALRQEGRTAQSLRALDEAGKSGPSRGQRRKLARTFLDLGEFRRALEHLDARDGVDSLQDIARAQAGLGASLGPQERKRAAQEKPKGIDALLERARAHAARGDKRAALRALAQAARLGASPGQSRELASAYLGLAEFKRALEFFDAHEGPADIDMLLERARAHAGLGQGEPAAAALEKTRRMSPNKNQSYAAALIYQDLKDYARSLHILDALTAQNPEEASFLVSRGVCEYLSGSVEKARGSLEGAIRLAPGLLPAYLSLGYIHEEQKRYDLALELYRRALSATGAAPAAPLRQELERAVRKAEARGR